MMLLGCFHSEGRDAHSTFPQSLLCTWVCRESRRKSPSSCLDFTLPLRCGQKWVDVRKTLATEIRGLSQGLHTSCGLRWGTKKLRARGSPFPVLQWMDALLQLFSSEISLAGSRGIHKEVPAWWRLPFREWRSEQPFFRL